MSQCPFVKGQASGLAVGLPEGQMGNSEVGHLNMGAGRIVYQELTRITKSINDGDFFNVPEFLTAVENCKKKQFRSAPVWPGIYRWCTQPFKSYLRPVRAGKEKWP